MLSKPLCLMLIAAMTATSFGKARKRGRRRLNGVALTPSARVSKNQSERFVVPLLKSTMEGNRWML